MSDIEASILIRTKNEEQWIPHCLEAVLSQTDVKTEVVVLDNNSTDRNRNQKFPVKIYTYNGEYLPGKCQIMEFQNVWVNI